MRAYLLRLSLPHRSKRIGSARCLKKIGETKQRPSRKSDHWKNRNDIAGQSIDIEWNVCPGDTSVENCKRYKGSRRRPGTHLTVPDRIIFASMFIDITNWESQKVQHKCTAQANEVAIHAARFRPGYWYFCGPGSKKTWTHHEHRPSHQFADGESHKLALSDPRTYRQHLVFKCSNMLQTVALRKQRRTSGNPCQKRVGQS